MNNLKSIKLNFNLQKVICFISVIIFFIKFISWHFTSSLSIFSDAMESLINIISSFIGLISLYISSLPKDHNHPYGHGKIEFISAAIEGILIFIVGISILINTFMRIKSHIHTNEFFLYRLDHGIFLMFFTTACINYLLGFLSCKIGKKNKSLILIASGKHLKIDTYSTFGIVIGLFLLKITKFTWIDPIISIIFSFIILYTGLKLLRNATAGIMDESDKKLLNKLFNHFNEKRDIHWIDIHHLKAIKYGRDLHVDCHLTVPWFFNVKKANEKVKKLTKLTKNEFGSRVELSVYLEACSKNHCIFCFNKSCQVRHNIFQKKILWTSDRTYYKNKL
ncbi:cation diffusion facilitator family transporter [Blattabacterium cuenoti]|uniref:cation diffusion facilitator family transporter n=1 Tax=Blattabacterium cuenoti TaxID=1653831 RepID=UPI00163C83D9|nr:cation diffusion facilitator family transporter [Blattabacterium cuenoti]